MTFWQRLWSRKASQARITSSVSQVGQAISSPADYNTFARIAYMKSSIAYRCIHMIAESCGGIEWKLYKKATGAGGKKTEIEDHDLVKLMERPNPTQGRKAFIEAVVAYYNIAGNSFIEKVTPDLRGQRPPTELWTMQPDKMKIIVGKEGYPAAYVYQDSGNMKRFDIDVVKMVSPVMHLRSFNPTNLWWGMSPLEAGLLAVDQNNAIQRWNLALLQNSAVPSGVFQITETKSNPAASLTEEQYNRLKGQVDERYSGARNAGRPMLIEGGVAWQQMQLGPKDMDFINSKNTSAMDVALVYGVPPEMVGLGQKTFQNYAEARLAFYQEVILPTMDFIQTEFNRAIVPAFGDGIELEYNKDDIEALEVSRKDKFITYKDINFMKVNEKRKACGIEEADDGDVWIIGNKVVADLGEEATAAANESLGLNPDGTPKEPQVDENGDPIKPDPNADGSDPAKPAIPPKKPAPGVPGKVPPKKPVVAPAKGVDEVEGIEFKAVNLLTQAEKKKSARRQNALRVQDEKRLAKDLRDDFDSMNTKMLNVMRDSTSPQAAEFGMLKVIDDSKEHFEKSIARSIRNTMNDFGDSIMNGAKSENLIIETKASTRKFQQFVDQFIKTRTAQAITQITGTTRKKVHDVIREFTAAAQSEGGDYTLKNYADDVEENFKGVGRSRANTIARTETMIASTNGSLGAAKALQIPGLRKEWVSAHDDRVRDGGKDGNDADHEEADGQVVDVDEKFIVPPDCSMDCPGDTSAPADQVCNCRCVVIYKAAKNEGLEDE